jgi:hypothetical protein
MTLRAQNVRVTLPVGQAVEHVRRMLFQPFQLEKWLAIGFCAWLAHLGQQGFRGSYGGGGRHGNGDVQEWVQRARVYVLNNLYWIVPVAIAVVVLGLALWVLITWVSSRGKFMFLHCVARDSADVVAPWRNFAREANSLFWFRLALGGIQLVAILVLGTGIGALVWNIVHRGASVGNIAGVVLSGGVFLLICIVVGLIAKLTTDFVVPILFLRGGTCLEGWEILRGLLGANLGGFVLYILFQILLSLAIGASVLAVVLVTCCIAGCLLAIPYIGTVLFLPVLVFQRAYSIFYLRQYGPDYDVFAPSPGPASTLP